MLSKDKNLILDSDTFKKAVDNAYDHIVITGIDGVVLYANKAVARVTGFPIADIVGKKAGKLWGGLMNKDFYDKLWDQIKNKKQVFVGEMQNKKKDGTIYTAEVRITPVTDDNNNVKYFIGIERDITEEEHIKKLNETFVDRENKMIDLKNKIKKLESQLVDLKNSGN